MRKTAKKSTKPIICLRKCNHYYAEYYHSDSSHSGGPKNTWYYQLSDSLIKIQKFWNSVEMLGPKFTNEPS